MKQKSYTKLQLARLIDRENHMNSNFEGIVNYYTKKELLDICKRKEIL